MRMSLTLLPTSFFSRFYFSHFSSKKTYKNSICEGHKKLTQKIRWNTAKINIFLPKKFCLFLFFFFQRPYFWNSHSLLSNGHTCLVFNQRLIQCKWNAWLHTPHATLHSSFAPVGLLLFAPVVVVLVCCWLAWHSMQRSIMWLRQMAQVSTWMSQLHSATPCHFLISNRFGALAWGCCGTADGAPVSCWLSAIFLFFFCVCFSSPFSFTKFFFQENEGN